VLTRHMDRQNRQPGYLFAGSINNFKASVCITTNITLQNMHLDNIHVIRLLVPVPKYVKLLWLGKTENGEKSILGSGSQIRICYQLLSPCIVTWALKYHMKLINREKCSYKGIFH